MTDARQPDRTMDPFSRDVLEFPAVLELLRRYLSGALSEPLIGVLAPCTDLEMIRRDLARAGEAREYLRESPRPSLGSLRDPRDILVKLGIAGITLSAHEILALVEVARAAGDVRALFAKTPFRRLDELARSLPDLRSLVAALGGKILPDGTVDSSASPALARIRKEMVRLRAELQSTLEQLVRRWSKDNLLQDAVVTIRNDRFVIPVRVEEKRRVAGIVHGASSSGATVFVEPLETLPLNNELVELQDREYAEIQRILAEFSGRLRERCEELKAATEILSELDLAFAKAEFARQYDCCLPELATERAFRLDKVRHPLLEKTLRAQKREPVPLTIELAMPKTLMVISGPNTGGKTVALKTLGIAALMAQAGIPVPAAAARLPLFQRVLADIGDQQSIAANLSTFSAHVTNIQSMAAVAERDDLVLLDELGASTEPNEGAALAIAILEHFRARGAITFVTTHHSRLKAYGVETPEATNAAMEFDEPTLQPTYRLLIGLPGKSSALDVAERWGLEPSIVAKARTLLHPADAESAALIANLHARQGELERERTRLQQQGRELEARRVELEKKFELERRARLRDLDARLEETLRGYDRRFADAVADLRAQVDAARARRIERQAAALKQEAREEWNAQVLETLGAPPSPEEEHVTDLPAVVGDRVRVQGLSTPGTVTAAVGDEQLEVEVGRLRLRVQRQEVQALARRKAAASPAAVARAVDPPAEAPAEINVIGQTAEEAREHVDKFLDQAFLAGRFRLRVVHGHGKGILKKALHDLFASHPHVEKFYSAQPREGGAGATIVELKL